MSPTIWGLFLKDGEAGSRAIDVEVFQWFFLTVVGGAVAVLPFFLRLPENRDEKVEPLMIGGAILRPLRAATALVNLIDLRGLERRRGGRERKSE